MKILTKFYCLIFAAALILAPSGCSKAEPVYDSVRVEESMKLIEASLTPEQSKELTAAMFALAVMELDLNDPKKSERNGLAIAKELNGKTGVEIIAYAKKRLKAQK
jgi:hypothetical protein